MYQKRVSLLLDGYSKTRVQRVEYNINVQNIHLCISLTKRPALFKDSIRKLGCLGLALGWGHPLKL